VNLEIVVTELVEKIQRLMSAAQADQDGDDAEKIAGELADVYGMLGGILREQGDYPTAAAAYDRGFRFEADPRYATGSTYNALNRLVTRVLLAPGCLGDPDLLHGERELEFINVRHELAELRSLLQEEIKDARSADFWAAGDLSLICALSGDEPGMRYGLEKFRQLDPPQAAYNAYRRSIRALAQLDTPTKAALIEAEAAWGR
jgi:hypothetical protein